MKPEQPALPTQRSDGLWHAHPGDNFVLVTVASRIDSGSEPVGSIPPPRNLTVATTARSTHLCRTHPTPFALARPVKCSQGSAQPSARPAFHISRPTLSASTASHTTLRDDSRTALSSGGMSWIYDNSNFCKSELFLSWGLDQALCVLPRQEHCSCRCVDGVDQIHRPKCTSHAGGNAAKGSTMRTSRGSKCLRLRDKIVSLCRRAVAAMMMSANPGE